MAEDMAAIRRRHPAVNRTVSAPRVEVKRSGGTIAQTNGTAPCSPDK
jgi:hypothetical protein